ncbi:histidine kinase, partial [PVC group bacterium]|nr:histidine kinase [PVC group bacterium]
RFQSETPNFYKGFFSISGPRHYLDIFPKDTGKFIPAGSRMYLQIHYATKGKKVRNQLKVGLYFHDSPPKNELYTRTAQTSNILLPPQTKFIPVEAVFTLPTDAVLYELIPHMHARGKAFKYIAQFPDGSEETLLSVPNYNFYWQTMYELSEPLQMPKGTKIIAKGVYDNSDKNPLNPDPDVWVRKGFKTTDEMFIGYMNLTRPVKDNYSILGFIPL